MSNKKKIYIKIASIIFLAIVFGVLMSLRNEFAQAWMRVLCAMVAGLILGLMLLIATRPTNSIKEE